MSTTPLLDDEIVLYTKVDDYEARTAFVGPLRVEPGNLHKIVGKVELPAKPQEAWARCGLNGCNKSHRFGYIIRTNDGLETNCGHECGRREFGVVFEEVEAHANRVVEAQARRRAAMDVVLQAPIWRDQLRAAMPLVEREEARMLEFIEDFKERSSFWSQLHKIAKVGGVVKVPKWTKDGLREESLGRIDGCTHLHRSRLWSSETISSQISWLESLSGSSIAQIDTAGLDALMKKSEQVQRVLREAPTFIGDVRRFLQPKNFELFDAMCMHGVCRPGKEGWGDLIRKWTRATPHIEVQPPERSGHSTGVGGLSL